jgi:hypothetical protein
MRGVLGTQPSLVDLHLHTRASDGDDGPAELAERVAGAGVRVAAVTDHDTMGSVTAFRAAAADRFTVIPACEVSSTWRGQDTHCLAYWVSPTDAEFTARVGRARDCEFVWWRTWTERAAAFGVPLTWDDVERDIGPDRIAAVDDYLAVLLRYARDDPRFDRYAHDTRLLVAELCRPGQPLHVPQPWLPDLIEVIGWVLAADGVPVLAHPPESLTEADFTMLRAAGLAGLEVWTTWHEPRRSAELAASCARTGLIATAGSDYHGERVKQWTREPGLLPSIPVDPLSIVDALERCRAGTDGT